MRGMGVGGEAAHPALRERVHPLRVLDSRVSGHLLHEGDALQPDDRGRQDPLLELPPHLHGGPLPVKADSSRFEILRARGAVYRAQGLCRVCGADADGYVHCYEHRRYYRQKARERRQRLISEGVCYSCAKAPSERSGLCAGCHGRQAERKLGVAQERRRRWLAAGLCTSCGLDEPEAGFRRCEFCRERWP
jgi:hypothetical protein